MTRLLAATGFTPDGMQREFHFNREQVLALCDDTWTSITRAELQVYYSLALRHGVEFASLGIHPAWTTFDKPITVFSSQDANGVIRPMDLEAEQLMRTATGFAGTQHEGPISHKRIRMLMRTRNCLFIGSPRHNSATDYALRCLWPEGNSAPFVFGFPKWNELKSSSHFGRQVTGESRGCLVLQTDNGESTLEVSRQDGRASGYDFGVLVICRRPCGTKEDVTTIILGGHSGFSTVDMARDLAYGTVYVGEPEIMPGVPVVKVLAARWKRQGHRLQRATKGRGWSALADSQSLKRLIRKSASSEG